MRHLVLGAALSVLFFTAAAAPSAAEDARLALPDDEAKARIDSQMTQTLTYFDEV